ncbi:MAG: formate dehydrogenase accessory sulfurtransferase FdhD [Candidatus Methylopumilus sp.]|nr:formate dehydrogenase accessory sulfurtransferase FdhD [Candidatus Methylopumilus sp.]
MLSKSSFSSVNITKCRLGICAELEDFVAEEVPVALIYNGISHAVMLASPQDLEDFALGFSLAEGILSQPNQLYGIDVAHQDNGIELHLEIATERFHLLKDRRRSMAGRTGCGLCGAESLAQALRLPDVRIENSRVFDGAVIKKALASIEPLQQLQVKTGATHASAWADVDGNVLMLREDVGRHNALDKLLGARAKADLGDGFVITTSRASYEMVQKTAVAGVSMLVAISAPSGLAIRVAEQCGISLVGFARAEQYVVYTHPERLIIKKK